MMTRGEVSALVTKAFRDAFNDPNLVLTPDMTPAMVPRWDSHRYVAILIELEDQLGVEFEPRETDRLKTVGDLEDLVASRAT
jgi:acyl carrier protein